MLQTRVIFLFLIILLPSLLLAGTQFGTDFWGWLIAGLLIAVAGVMLVAFLLVWLMFLLALRAPDGQRARLTRVQRWSLLCREWLAALRLYGGSQLFAWPRNKVDKASGGKQSAIVVLVHGYFCNTGFFSAFARRLRSSGWQTIRLHMLFGYNRVDAAAARLRDELHRIRHRYPGRPIVLVGHSMGGVASVSALCRYDLPITGAVVVGAPLHGTLFGQWRLLGAPGGWRQPGIGEICRIESDQRLPIERLQCVFSWHDNIVVPQSSARLQGVDEAPLQRVGHLEMAFSRVAHDAIIRSMEHLVDKGLRQ